MPEYNPYRIANQIRNRETSKTSELEFIETPYQQAFFIDKQDSNWEDPIREFLTAHFRQHHNPLKYINAVVAELAALENLSSSHQDTPKSKREPLKSEIRINIYPEKIVVYYWEKKAKAKSFTIDKLHFLRKANSN